MGHLRLLLALAVVIQHSAPFFGYQSVGGMAAVQLFFIISGFYMTLILNEKYLGPGSLGLFLSNRALRIYPIYWVVLAATAGLGVLTWLVIDKPVGALAFYIRHWEVLDWRTLPVLALANLGLFAQDWILFFGIDPNTGAWFASRDFKLHEPAIHEFVFVRPAWTLGLEMTFYVIAPFVVRRGLPFLLGLLGASLALRLWMFHGLGLDGDPWVVRFFPTELALFLLGAIGWHVLRADIVHRLLGANGALALVGTFLSVVLLFEFLPTWHIKHWALYALAVPAIPALFVLTQHNAVDRWIGELSYPVYISHVLLIVIAEQVLDRLGLQAWQGPIAVVLAIAAGVLLVRFVADPVERIRAARAARGLPTPTSRTLELRPAG